MGIFGRSRSGKNSDDLCIPAAVSDLSIPTCVEAALPDGNNEGGGVEADGANGANADDGLDGTSDISDDYVAPSLPPSPGKDDGSGSLVDAAEAILEREGSLPSAGSGAAAKAGSGEAAARALAATKAKAASTKVPEKGAAGGSAAVDDLVRAASLEIARAAGGGDDAYVLAEERSGTSGSSARISLESLEDGYVAVSDVSDERRKQGRVGSLVRKVGDALRGRGGGATARAAGMVFERGAVQSPGYRDLKYAMLFGLHLVVPIWWYAESFSNTYSKQNYAYYGPMNHLFVSIFVFVMSLSALVISFITFGYMLRHGTTMLKTTVMCSTLMCIGLGAWGLLMGQMFMAVCGFTSFAIASMYANMVWSRMPFTAANISVAISALRANMGVFLAANAVAAVGFAWLLIYVMGGVSGYRTQGGWALAYAVFSYYWTHQVLSNVVSATAAGTLGRWIVIGEATPGYSAGLKETLAISRTYSLGCICFGGLFFGIVQILHGLSSFLRSKYIPLLPVLLDWVLSVIGGFVDEVNEWAYVYVGLYGYSYTDAARNVDALFRGKGWDGVIRYQLAGNIMLMPCMAIGMITGFAGLIFGGFQYKLMLSNGMNNPESDGFFIGFLVGFLVSSILLSVVTATINTIIVCLAESPAVFKSNHPTLYEELQAVWKDKARDTRGEI